jgi:hypothetical protein
MTSKFLKKRGGFEKDPLEASGSRRAWYLYVFRFRSEAIIVVI